MSEMTCPRVRRKAPTAVRNIAVNFSDWLDHGEIITGTPTVAVSPSGPTLSAASVNSGRRVVDNRSCAPGSVVTFTVSGGTANTYTITITASTSGSQTLVGYITLVVAES